MPHGSLQLPASKLPGAVRTRDRSLKDDLQQFLYMSIFPFLWSESPDAKHGGVKNITLYGHYWKLGLFDRHVMN